MLNSIKRKEGLRLAVKSQGPFLARIDTMRRIAAANGGAIPPTLHYYGAHTGRFAGGGGINLQNFGRAGEQAELRKALIPSPDHRFIVADLAQVEARIVAWYAGQQRMLEAFAQGRDLYSEFASEVFGEEVRKPVGDESGGTARRLGALRQIGKAAILGLGFNVGAKRFHEELNKRTELRPLFDEGKLSQKICARIVRKYRNDYPEIPAMWKGLDSAFREVRLGGRLSVQGVVIENQDHLTRVWLPSRRALRYADPRLDYTPRTIVYLDEEGEEQTFEPTEPGVIYGRDEKIYGGLLTENIVQATARDILVEAMLDLEDDGLPTLFHVHDELILKVPSDAAGLPLACEAEIADRYAK